MVARFDTTRPPLVVDSRVFVRLKRRRSQPLR